MDCFKRNRTVATAAFSSLAFFATTLSVAAAPDQTVFDSPSDAARELIEVLSANDTERLTKIFGPDSKDLIASGDPVTDRASRDTFVALAAETHRVETNEDGSATLFVGQREWPFPIPLERQGNGWIFDTDEGREEILNRRVGKNELDTIENLLTFVEAQKQYFELKPLGKAEYAKRIASSTPQTRDGLFWARKPGEPPSPLGPLAAEAQASGYKTRAELARAFYGYRYKILTKQGAHAAGGKKEYLSKDGRLTKGFAFVAYPADWSSSGVMTFITNQDGVIFEKDLGSRTTQIVEAMTAFDPGEGWKPVDTSDIESAVAEIPSDGEKANG